MKTSNRKPPEVSFDSRGLPAEIIFIMPVFCRNSG